ncbi:hypothetical protein CVT25_011116 [Psilocybe cyanescens]|uniref:Myb-like domain-containing protein n=1 Tax=Psilocybe cyanescens TaxID=93625 RepID=A0A409WGS3_PSICY|nr:hypothetical protein CVT25_011116 [Psilocybe cyanescens]
MDAFGIDPSEINASSSLNRDKKKKSKRPREDEHREDDTEVREKKRKRKHTHAQQDIEIEESSPAVEPEVALSLDPPTSVIPKKKKKDKIKSKGPSLSEQTDAEIEANSQASAAALLSAIVAASVTNPEPSQQMPPPPPPFDPNMVPSAGQQYMPYPSMHPPYGYPPQPPPGFDPSGQPPSVFSPPAGNGGGGAFSELSFGSNEDLLRALQDLDMSKIASVLKSLGETANVNNNQSVTPLSYLPTHLMQLPPATLGQFPAHSNSILGITPKQIIPHPSHKRTINMSLPGNEQHTDPDHAHILANKWLNPSKLAELVRDEGLIYKKGKFSAIEEEQLKSAIQRYMHEKQLSQEQLLEKIFSKADKSKDTAFWSELTAAVPLRPIIAVYHHVRRSYHPLKQQGAWHRHEDEALKQAVIDLGQQWEKVSYRVGRMASDCRDRYRNHIFNRDIRISGHWSKEEEDRLTEIVTDMTVKQGRDIDNDVFWGRVSELMGGSRGRQQCRIKWTDALSKIVKNEGQKPRWGQQDAFILVHKIDSLNVRDDTEIDWKLIPDPDWNLWSAHTLQRRWLTMKKGIKGYEDMTHQEIMDILRVKKAHLPTPPPPSSRKRKERKVTSAPAINEPDASVPEAGSSTGPGTEGAHESSTDSED